MSKTDHITVSYYLPVEQVDLIELTAKDHGNATKSAGLRYIIERYIELTAKTQAPTPAPAPAPEARP